MKHSLTLTVRTHIYLVYAPNSIPALISLIMGSFYTNRCKRLFFFIIIIIAPKLCYASRTCCKLTVAVCIDSMTELL